MRYLPLVLILTITSLVPAQTQPTTSGKKLIQYGWDSPDTVFYRKHLKQIEASPFDGIVLTVRNARGEGALGGNQNVLGWSAFNVDRFKPKEYQHAIEDLIASKSTKLTDNFIALVSQPPDQGFDWFDDAHWKVVLYNVRMLAQVARKGNCAGIMFDPEEYVFPMWSYGRMPQELRAKHDYTAYVKQVRQRGSEFIKSINSEYPKITILTLFGPALYAQGVNSAGPEKAAEAGYNLLGPFYDGIIEGADDDTTLVDGYEQSYGFKKEQDFIAARAQMTDKPSALSAVPDRFSKIARVGYGLWLDNQSGAKGNWFPNDPAKNHFTPAEWQASVHYALAHSDKYVWIYNERAKWWDNTPGEAYVQAMMRARKSAKD